MKDETRVVGHRHGPRPPLADITVGFFGALISISLIGFTDQVVLHEADLGLVIGAFGATAVLVFGAPGSPFAQPWNVFVGHVLSAVIGVFAVSIFGVHWVAAAVAVALSIAAMQMTRSIHPPGGATALIAVVGSERIHNLGYYYVLVPVGLGALLLLVVALFANNIGQNKRWPVYWY